MKIIYISLAIIFVLSSSVVVAVEVDRISAVVNKEVITLGEILRAMELESRSKTFEKSSTLTAYEKAQFFRENRAVFLEEMINRRLQIQEAERLGINVSEMELSDTIENIARSNLMDARQFISALKKEGLSLKTYKKMLSEEIIIGRLIEHEVRSKITVRDDEVNEYMKAQAGDDETYRLELIFFKKPQDSKDEKPLEEKALKIIDMLTKGEEFQGLLKQYSDEGGGELGIIKVSEMSSEFQEALKTARNGISKPFWTAQGLNIIKFEKAQPTNIEPIRKTIAEKKFQQELKDWLKRLRENSFIEIRL